MLKGILLLFFSLVLGFGIAVILVYLHVIPDQSGSHAIVKPIATGVSQFSIENVPSTSIRGDIGSISGTVMWELRVATTPATITQSQVIQQGEEVITGNNGRATISFPGVGIIKMQPNTDLGIIQTIPADIVISQNAGSADYTKTGKSPLTIRSFDSIIDIVSGESRVTTSTILSRVTALVENGSITAAFNDSQQVSNVLTASAGQEFIFDETTATGNVE